MYAILQTGGKQYVASPGEVIRVESLAGEPGDTVEFDQIVTVSQDDGSVLSGSAIEGAKVTGVIDSGAILVFIILFAGAAFGGRQGRAEAGQERGPRQGRHAVRQDRRHRAVPAKRPAGPFCSRTACRRRRGRIERVREDLRGGVGARRPPPLVIGGNHGHR